MHRLAAKACTAAVIAVAASSAGAVSVDIGTDDTSPIPDSVTSADLFSDLAGATVSFDGTQTTWVAGSGDWGTGATCGGAAIADYSLGGCGDTFDGEWLLSNGSGSALIDLVVNLTGIGHFFDRTDPSPGTPGSFAGRDFTYLSSTMPGIDGRISVVYSEPGQDLPNAPDEDLYGVMAVSFADLTNTALPTENGLIDDTQLVFQQDTDPPVIPLPAGAWLLLTGATALVAVRRRRQG